MNEEYLLGIIATIEKSKGDGSIAPTYALREEIISKIFEDMRQCLEKLLQTDKIKYSRTLNSWAVQIKL